MLGPVFPLPCTARSGGLNGFPYLIELSRLAQHIQSR